MYPHLSGVRESQCPPAGASSTSNALRAGKQTRPRFGPRTPFVFFSLCASSLLFSIFPSLTRVGRYCPHRTILTTSFVLLWKTIQRCTRSVSLALIGLYPITGALYLFLVMPLATCFAFPDDLPPGVNPLKPKDYVFLIKKTWFAMKRNNFKVEGKDL